MLVVVFSIVKCQFGSSVGSGSTHGATGTLGLSGSGLVHSAVATFTASHAKISASVTV